MSWYKAPQTQKEAMTLAITLVLTASDKHEEQVEQILNLIKQLSFFFTAQEIDEIKAVALAEAHLILGEEEVEA